MVPHRSVPSSGSTTHGAFSDRKMCDLTFGTSQVRLFKSIELIVILMSLSSKVYAMLTGVPQLEQNVRSANSDNLRVLSVDESVYVSALLVMLMKGRYADPESC